MSSSTSIMDNLPPYEEKYPELAKIAAIREKSYAS